MNPPIYLHITVSFKGEIQQSLTVPGPKAYIGRSQECQVRLDNAGISRTHAVLTVQDGEIEVEDLESGNGTFINGITVQSATLKPTDKLTIGKFSISVKLTDTPMAAEPTSNQSDAQGGHERTVYLSPGEQKQILQQSQRQQTASASVSPSYTKQPQSSSFSLFSFLLGLAVGLGIWGLNRLFF